ncbi:maleylpyruvate isomerase N-terminal domain-containing protein [Actinomadura harenae]|uniref:Mycothiol-dependent maleylpyruvate isomerase metal-binding domain-containing protein n=1 Tax=Actinomadura harenae TaxID=2483351 RepID=A0A3M2LT83_9ACTN|nr:maleylpyruvate isomerase N-terminal domain-containing protein [Actinomadura harenae]RMI40617.1 hypothetical protein EBO15_26095 [Actinomadura harenae]
MDHFSRAWTALLAAVAETPDEDFERPSGCVGWSVRNLACHLVIEWTLHHLDLIAHLPNAADPPAETVAASRALLERIAGADFPKTLSDKDALLIGTGRRTLTTEEKATLADFPAKLPLILG